MKIICIFLVVANITYFLWQIRDQKNIADLSVGINAPSLTLLGESSGSVASQLPNDGETDEVDDVVAIHVPHETRICSVLGGFVDQLAAEQAIKLLSERGIESKLNIVDIPGTGSYLVYLPPLQSRADALTKLHELQANRIDSFIIGDGERINGISLGVFAKEESAKKLQAQLRDKGYSPSITNSSRMIRQYNLRIIDHSEQMLIEGLIEEIAKKYAGGKLARIEQTCSE